jgi:hypothetical protein
MFSMAMTRSVHNNAPDALAFVHQVESAGAAGKITVSEAIYHRTKDLFDFEPRGGVEVDLMSLRGISSAVRFIRRVGDGLADGKPCVIGNCQAGWAVTMLAAEASIGPHHDCPGARQRELKDLSQPENPARIEGCGVQSPSRGPSCVELRVYARFRPQARHGALLARSRQRGSWYPALLL